MSWREWPRPSERLTPVMVRECPSCGVKVSLVLEKRGESHVWLYPPHALLVVRCEHSGATYEEPDWGAVTG